MRHFSRFSRSGPLTAEPLRLRVPLPARAELSSLWDGVRRHCAQLRYVAILCRVRHVSRFETWHAATVV